MIQINEETRLNIIQLCRKVKEVVNNNDWPTEEGQRNEFGNCSLLDLVYSIQENVKI